MESKITNYRHKKNSEQTPVKVSSECQTCDLQPTTRKINNESGTVFLTTFDNYGSMAYTDRNNHLENINKQPKDSDRQSSSDSGSGESKSEEETYRVECNGCQAYH